MKNFLLISSAVFFLSACSSALKLDDVKVEDKSTASLSAVAPVVTTPSSANTLATTSPATTTLNLHANESNRVSPEITMAEAAATAPIVYFDYDSFAVRPEFQSLIETHASKIIANKNTRVMIEGHTDERGGREYNLALGQKRAESVRQVLKLLGVVDAQMEAVSFGKEKPAVTGSSDDAMAKNRRAVINYR